MSGANLITITKYSGVDPEIVGGGSGNQAVDTNAGVINTQATNSSTNFGVDRGNYSPVRTYLLGLQVKF